MMESGSQDLIQNSDDSPSTDIFSSTITYNLFLTLRATVYFWQSNLNRKVIRLHFALHI